MSDYKTIKQFFPSIQKNQRKLPTRGNRQKAQGNYPKGSIPVVRIRADWSIAFTRFAKQLVYLYRWVVPAGSGML